MPPTPHPRHAELLAALRAPGLEVARDFWLVYNGIAQRLRWFAHTTPEQHV